MSGAHPGAGGSGTVADAHRALLISRRDDGTILHASDALCRLLGRTADEIVGRTPSTIGLASEARVDWVRQRAPVVGKGYRYTRELQTAAGPLLADVELHAAVIGGDEVIISTVEPAVAPDSASDADVLGLVLDQAPVGVVVYDRDLRIMRVTRRVEEMGRITPRHIGLRLEEAFPDVAAVFLDAIRQVFATGSRSSTWRPPRRSTRAAS